MSGPFGFGSSVWPGVAKLIEECGEVGQVCGKLIQTDGAADHWDGTDLRARLEEEIADVMAASHFVILHGALDAEKIASRVAGKLKTFERWHAEEAAKVVEEKAA